MAPPDGSRTREDLAREVSRRHGLPPEAAFARAAKAIETMTTLGLVILIGLSAPLIHRRLAAKGSALAAPAP
jgi:hypothetical protein